MHHKAREAIRSFPDDVKDKLGQSLLDVQYGLKLTMPKSRPVPSLAAGVEELRVKGPDGIYRIFYFTRDERGIFLFHAFVKKTRRTPPLEIELGRARLKELLYEKN